MTENEGFEMEEESVEDSSSPIAFDASDEPASGSKPESRMILLLLLLLVVVAVGGYFYFGGLSVPQPPLPKVVKTPPIAVPVKPPAPPV
ncbi:MAG TPA: hypothetical protein VJ955_08440, partial [Desulfuromonadales bacterium]|nr:hypothetical protein [Desulfuromonadales bacterium]